MAPAAACPPRGGSVTVAVEDPAPQVRTDRSAAALRAESGAPWHPALQHLGLTVSRVEWRSLVEARIGPVGPGEEACATAAAVTLTLGHAEHVVRVASEVPRDSCLQREVEAHEQRHVEVNRRTLRDAARHLETAARAWIARAEAVGATPDTAFTRLQDSLRDAVEPTLARKRRARAGGHTAIDTPKEYRRLGRVCPADQRLLRARLLQDRG